MMFVSFNVNGLRAAIAKVGIDFFMELNADFLLLQEIKLKTPLENFLPGYFSAWNFPDCAGYAGTAILSKQKPNNIKYDFGTEFDTEGRVITFEYPLFFLVNVYVPNSQGSLDRWYYRLDWNDSLVEYLSTLLRKKSVIIGGDFNVAHNYIDIYPENTKNLEKQSGFREEERGGFDNLLELGFVDTFRLLNATKTGSYTWWSAKNNNRENNKGRCIDYFLVSDDIQGKIRSSQIFVNTDISISDHVPIKLIVEP